MNWKHYLTLTLVLALLLSLRMTWGLLSWQPGGGGGERGEGSSRPLPAKVKVTRPPAVLPDLLSGYIFNKERDLDPAEAIAFGGGGRQHATQAGGDIDKVSYSGSIMFGLQQKALVAYPARIRGPKGKDRAITQHRVLSPGDDFIGYKVEAVEPLRLVLTRNGEKVVKQLYDKTKVRKKVLPVPRAAAAAAEARRGARREAVVPRSPTPARGKKAVSRPPLINPVRRVVPKPVVGRPVSRSQRRMQRLRLENPGIFIPPPAGNAAVPPQNSIR